MSYFIDYQYIIIFSIYLDDLAGYVFVLFILTIGGLGIWAIVDLINILTDNF